MFEARLAQGQLLKASRISRAPLGRQLMHDVHL